MQGVIWEYYDEDDGQSILDNHNNYWISHAFYEVRDIENMSEQTVNTDHKATTEKTGNDQKIDQQKGQGDVHVTEKIQDELNKLSKKPTKKRKKVFQFKITKNQKD